MKYELSNGKDRVYQWDHDIVLTILEPENVPTVHFRWGGKAVPITVTNQQVEIPPELLQQPKDIILWAYTPDHTMDMARIPLEKRPKPSDYAYTPTEIKTWEDLDARIKALEDGGGIAGVSSVNGQTGTVTITAEGLGALTEDDLQEATDKALAQAKASGEFDGAQGPKGETGPQGPAGPTGPAGAGLDVTGATVGQTVKIAAVDSNGVPTEWVPADFSGITVETVTIAENVSVVSFDLNGCDKIALVLDVPIVDATRAYAIPLVNSIPGTFVTLNYGDTSARRISILQVNRVSDGLWFFSIKQGNGLVMASASLARVGNETVLNNMLPLDVVSFGLSAYSTQTIPVGTKIYVVRGKVIV